MANKIKTTGQQVAKRGQQTNGYNVNNLVGTYIGLVVDNVDSLHTGRIKVRLTDFSSADADRICLLAIPYGGNTDIKDSADDETAYGDTGSNTNGSPKSFGMWPQPPAVGTNVVVTFTGTMEQGIVMGSLIAKDRNATMGGNASSQVYDGDQKILMPSSEKNPNDVNDPDTRPANPAATATLLEQGTAGDFVRGHSMSSARRESPSKVFGITTLGGHTISMDDGQEGGSSKNMRIKTQGGHQILLEDNLGFIYITNSKGNAWIEIDSAGRMDFFSEGGISIHTEGDYNIHAKGNINMQADQGVNIKATGGEGLKLETSVGSIDAYSAINISMQADANYNLLVAGNSVHTSGRIDMNGPAAAAASKATIQAQTANSGITTSIASRVPEHHPWAGASSVQESFDTGKGNT
jgi:hypothetical protein